MDNTFTLSPLHPFTRLSWLVFAFRRPTGRRAFAARAVAAAITAAVTAIGAAWRRRGRFAWLAAALFTQQGLARQLDAVLVVDGNHFDLQLVADLDDVFHLIDKLVVQFADVT